MKGRKLGIVILLSIFLVAFSSVFVEAKVKTSKKESTTKVEAKDSKKVDEAENEKNLEKLKKETKGQPIIAAIIKIAEEVTKRIELEIKLSDIIGLVGITSGPVKDYLDKFVIKSPTVEAVMNGMSIRGTIVVNNNPLNAIIEIGKKGKKSKDSDKDKADKDKKKDTKKDSKKDSKKDDKKSGLKEVGGGWYVLFYVESPDKWLLSDYFPDTFDIKKMLPGLDFDAFAKKGEPLKPDFFELEDSYFYISTADLDDHGTIDKVSQGVGFKGKLKFIGIFSIFDKIFGLKGEPIEFDGAVKIPKFVGTRFSIKIPAEPTIIPEYYYVKGKKVTFIEGFKVTLAPQELGIVFTEGIPSLNATGGIKVDLPFVKETLEFYLGMKFAGTRLKLFGGQKTKLADLFGIKDLDVNALEIGLTWDFLISAQLAGATAGAGVLLGLLPVGVIFKGGMQSGKSKLDIDADISLHATKGLDLYYNSLGSLYVKDFIKFWLGTLVKDPKAMEAFLKTVPPFVFEDIKLEAAWSEEKGKKFEFSAGRVELIPDVPATAMIKISADGLVGNASMGPLFLPNKEFPFLEVTRKDDKEKGPYFDLKALISPPGFSLESDGRIAANLGELGKIDSGTKVDISDEGIILDTSTKFLDLDAYLKIGAKLLSKPKDWYVKGGFSQKVTKEINKILTKASKDLLNAAKDLSKIRQKALKQDSETIKKVQAEIDKAKNKAVADIKAHFNNLKKGTQWRINELKKEIKEWKSACGKKPWLEKPWCNLFQVTSREIAVAALEIHKNITLNIVSGIAQIGTNAAMDVGKMFATTGVTIVAGVKQTGLLTAEIFTKAAKEITEIVNYVLTQLFVIHKFDFDANLGDLVKLKLPYVELDLTIFGKRRAEPLRLQLDVKKPAKFFMNLTKYLFSPTLEKTDKIANGATDEAEKNLEKATSEANKKLIELKEKAGEEALKAKKEAKAKGTASK
ncbi:hypothetical protein ACFLYU_04430 [Candidatus Dependentiae bacterium]